jgi:hypothetical protein
MVKLHFAMCRYVVRTLSTVRLFYTVFGPSDTLSHSFEVRSSCNRSQLEPVDLYEILKFSLLVRRNILYDLPKNF